MAEAGKRQELPTQEPTPKSLAEVDANPREILKMWCGHGQVPTTGCDHCYNENPRNWDPPQTLPEEIKPLTDEMRAHHLARYAVLDAYPNKRLGPGLFAACDIVLPESGRISSATPHTSAPPSERSSRDFSKTSTTDTNQITLGATLCEDHCINKKPHYGPCTVGYASRPTLEQLEEENKQEDRRESPRRTYVLPESSWKGTLGRAPEMFKNKEKKWTTPNTTPVVSAQDLGRIVNGLATLGIAQGKAVSIGGAGYVVKSVTAAFDPTRNDVMVQLQFTTGR
jgi:hypothetical protein